jgi:hypothetical protein
MGVILQKSEFWEAFLPNWEAFLPARGVYDIKSEIRNPKSVRPPQSTLRGSAAEDGFNH